MNRENWDKIGIKHLIECHCTLKIYKGSENHLYHKFPVYSKFDNQTNKLIEKIVPCNNCQTLHKVYDVCKSDIVKSGKDENKAAVSIEDISLQLPYKINNVLVKYQSDISTWEQVLDIVECEAWSYKVVLSRELIEGKYHVKTLEILSEDKIKIESKIIEDEIKF
tara:strand:+ start:515 stop:1009 length:495 start_codon:yes stop_codon:yes gene_type:complete